LLGDGRITHLPGGVDEYLRRRAAEESAASSAAAAARTAAAATLPDDDQVGLEPARQRALRKDLLRLERKLESLQRKESQLHDRLTTAGADYAAAAELSVTLKALQIEVAGVEAQWLTAAEDLESG
jgi:ATP-binding cassette subfamily F protein uup